MKKQTIKRVKAWAVVQPDMQNTMPLAKVYNPTMNHFVDAIFQIKEQAEQYNKVFYKSLKTKVVPCTIIYTLHSPKKR